MEKLDRNLEEVVEYVVYITPNFGGLYCYSKAAQAIYVFGKLQPSLAGWNSLGCRLLVV